LNGWVVEQFIFGQWCGGTLDQHSSSDCVRQQVLIYKGSRHQMLMTLVPPLVSAAVYVQRFHRFLIVRRLMH
jgi:hypothetical protein